MHNFTGRICSKDFFHFYEENSIDLDNIFKVLKGEVAGSIFRNIIPSQVCEKIEKNFWTSPFKKNREDKIPAYYIGTYHYGKDLDTYFQEAKDCRPHLDLLFKNTQPFVNHFINDLKDYLGKKGIEFRLAEHFGKRASPFRISSFPEVKPYGVRPHDDVAQLGAVLQKGFEIQNVTGYEVATVNFCLANNLAREDEENSGEFNYWNIQPNDHDRKQLGVEEKGYPYPPELLQRFDKIEFPVYKGDVFLLNGRNIHGVGPVIGEATNRVTMQFFMGFINKNTVVYWV